MHGHFMDLLFSQGILTTFPQHDIKRLFHVLTISSISLCVDYSSFGSIDQYILIRIMGIRIVNPVTFMLETEGVNENR